MSILDNSFGCDVFFFFVGVDMDNSVNYGEMRASANGLWVSPLSLLLNKFVVSQLLIQSLKKV